MVTATANELTAPSRGLVAALRHSIPRNEFFAALYILGIANGLVGRMYSTSKLDSWADAVTSLDINVIVLFACFAGVSTILFAERERIRSMDLAVAAVFLIVTAIP